jgi:hypothetical protein
VVIALDVRRDLRGPVCSIVPFGQFAKSGSQVASVPEVTIAKDHHALAWEDKIRTPWDSLGGNSVSEWYAPNRAAQE